MSLFKTCQLFILIFFHSLRGQTDLGDVQLLKHVEHANHVLVIHVVRAFDHDAQFRVFGLELLQIIPELRNGDGLVVQKRLPFLVHDDAVDLGLFILRQWRFGGRQVHFEIVHHLRRGDVENDQQHEHQVEQGRDVQLVQRTVL